MVRMNKIIGSAKDFKKKPDTGKPKDTPTFPGLTDSETLKHDDDPGAPKGLIVPRIEREEPLVEAGLELPPDDMKVEVPVDEVSEDHQTVYREACRFVGGFMTDAAALDINTLAEQAQKIIFRVHGDDGLLRLAMRPTYIEPFLGAHPVNVAILAALVAEGRQFDQQQQLRVVVSALVHDIGMTRLNTEILQNQRDLTPEEKADIEQHPNYGSEIILEALGTGYSWLAKAVRQEHERARGQGYPNRLPLESIDNVAQLVGLLDVYEAIIHPRRQHDAFCPSKAVKQVIETRNELFSPQMIKALVEAVSVYPVETFVLLNTGQIGRVTATHRKNPLRPVIQVQTDHNRNRISDKKEINLKEYPVLSIVKSLDTVEVEELTA